MLPKCRIWVLLTVVACGSLAACGGAESRLASHMKRGREYYAEGNYAKAGVEFRNALQIAPKDPAARIMGGRTSEALGKPADAAHLYQAVLDADPNNMEARIALARVYVFGDAPDLAAPLIEQGLAKDPNSAPLLTYRAAVETQQKKTAEAVKDVDRALQIDPANEDAVGLRAGIYRDAGDFAAAAALVAHALERLPNSTVLREVLVNLYARSGDADKAEQQLRALVKLRQTEPRYRYELADFLVGLHRVDEGQRVLEDAVKEFPDTDEPKLALVEFLARQRGAAQAESALRNFIAKKPDDYDLQLNLGAMLAAAGDTKQARTVYEEVVKQDGTNAKGLTARNRLATIDASQYQYDAALAQIGEVLKKSPRDDDALELRGEIELRRGDATATISDLRAVLRDQPQALRVHRLLARAYVDNGEMGLAEQSLRTALDIAPANLAVRVELAQVLGKLQRQDEAVGLLEDAVRKSPSDPAARDALIRAYVARNDLTSAQTAVEDLKRLAPQSASAYYLAGLIAEGQKRADDAIKEYDHSLQLQPKAFEPLSAIVKLQIANGHTAEAFARLNSAITADPKNAQLQNFIGQLDLAQHNNSGAIAALNDAVSLAPSWWIPYRNLALAKYANKDRDGAIAAYLAGIKAAPAESQLPTELAILYVGAGKVDDAISLYESWHQRNPHVQMITNNLAMLLVTYKKDRASLDLARDLSASFATSNDGALLDTNGWVHFKRAEYSDALPVLQRAAERSPQSKEISYHLGMAELHNGQRDRARKDLENALSGAGDFAGSAEARTALASLKSQSG